MLNCKEYSQICTKAYSPQLLNQRAQNLSLLQVGNSAKLSTNLATLETKAMIIKDHRKSKVNIGPPKQ